MSEVGTPEFDQMMETLETLQRCWSEGKKAAIVEIVEQQEETLDLQLDLTAGEHGRPQDDADYSRNTQDNATEEPVPSTSNLRLPPKSKRRGRPKGSIKQRAIGDNSRKHHHGLRGRKR